jgi:hypothetical protein
MKTGYAPHEGNSVNLAANHGFDSLFLDGFTKEEVSQAWWSSLAEYAVLVKNDLEKQVSSESGVPCLVSSVQCLSYESIVHNHCV